MLLYFRAYAKCPDSESTATKMAARIMLALPSRVSAALLQTPKRVREKPDLVEFLFDLRPYGVFEEIVSLTPEGWERSGMQMNKCAEWRRTDDGHAFLISEIVCASIDLIDATESPPHVAR
jgi:hypothetical protein